MNVSLRNTMFDYRQTYSSTVCVCFNKTHRQHQEDTAHEGNKAFLGPLRLFVESYTKHNFAHLNSQTK